MIILDPSTTNCPRCQSGCLAVESDSYGPFIHCLMCGFMADVPRQKRPGRPQEHAPRTRTRAKMDANASTCKDLASKDLASKDLAPQDERIENQDRIEVHIHIP